MKPGHTYMRKAGNSSIICTLQCYLHFYMSAMFKTLQQLWVEWPYNHCTKCLFLSIMQDIHTHREYQVWHVYR